MSLSDYQASTADWREQLRVNSRRTRYVVLTFISVYLLVGLIIDCLILHAHHQQVPLEQIMYAIITFQVFPVATVILAIVAVVSILITFTMYDKLMLLGTDAHEVTLNSAAPPDETKLYHVVEEMKVAANMNYMPKVYVIEADYMNAFASGYSEKSAMVAITRGLMNKLDRAELQAVMAHELSHIRHQDTKLTLSVAVLSNILLMVVDILFYSVFFSKNKKGNDNRLMFVIFLLRLILPMITVVLTLFLSRTREYMADAGCVELMRDNEPMARALLKINDDHKAHAEAYAKAYGSTAHEQVRQSSYLFDPTSIEAIKSLSHAFSTHPSISDRLKAIGFRLKS